jgi:hypothetical protein
VSERVHLSVVSQPVKRRLGGWCEMAGRQPGTQLVELSVDKISARVAVTRGSECGRLEESPSVQAVGRKQLMETVID